MFEGADASSIAVTPRALATRHWRDGLPSPLQLERAIGDIESALMRERLARAARSALLTSEPLLAVLLPPAAGGAGQLDRDQVERRFDDLAAAALVILRECMDHLGFDELVIEPGV